MNQKKQIDQLETQMTNHNLNQNSSNFNNNQPTIRQNLHTPLNSPLLPGPSYTFNNSPDFVSNHQKSNSPKPNQQNGIINRYESNRYRANSQHYQNQQNKQSPQCLSSLPKTIDHQKPTLITPNTPKK